MFKLDNALLEELGLGSLPPAEKNRMLAHIYETLEMRVGMKLAEQMSNDQLDEFESYIDKNDEAGALKWLESNFPNYKQVVADQLEQLKAEVKQAAPQIVAASQQNAAINPPAPAQPIGTPPYQPPQPQTPPPAWQPPSVPQPPPAPLPPQPNPSPMPPAQPFPEPPAQPPMQPPAAPGPSPYQAPQSPFQPMPPQWQPPAPGGTPPAPDDQSNVQPAA